jgi:hypothetical protein
VRGAEADIIARAWGRAREAIGRADVQLGSPFAAAEARVLCELGFEGPRTEEMVAFWESRQAGSRAGDDRYRWEVSHKRCQPGAHVPPEVSWRLFRPDLPRDGDRMELALSLPVSIAEQTNLLCTLAEGDGGRAGDLAARARNLLTESEPVMRRDLATCIAALNPWTDTFTLRCLVRHDRALARFGPIALAIATSYAFLADKGYLAGLRHPFYDKPLVSATAQLAAALVKLGVELGRLGSLVSHVRAAQRGNGAWGDAHGLEKTLPREDLLATLACAELLSRVDPTFDPTPALAWIARAQEPSGFFVAHGPELVWLTGEVIDLAGRATLPFPERFSFPHVAPLNLDRKTLLPFYAYFDDLARLFAELPGIAVTTTELAFIDLAGFRAFNTQHGQDMGDLVLGAFAEAIARVPGARAIRDGGDEFLVVGAPTRRAMASDLDATRARWPDEFRRRFPGAEVVVPRILVATTRCADVRACREALGRRVGDLKARAKSPPPEGVLEVVS